MIRLTSFVEARRLRRWELMSGARWAPTFAVDWPVVEWMRPLYPDGRAVKLRDFGDAPLKPYRDYMLAAYRSRWPEIREWLAEVGERDIAVACWCPYTKTAARQLERFSSFHCHMGVVGEVLTATETAWEFGDEHASKMVRGA